MPISDYHVVGDASLAPSVPAKKPASDIGYDNTSSGMSATDVQEAIDELASGSGGGAVTGVKGDSESTYRTGNVNLTKANIGLSDVNNTSDADKPISTATQIALNGKLDTSLKGANSGLAELDSNGKVPNSQLPGYVDDVLEYASLSVFPATGESGKIYVALDTNKTYRWSGTTYIEISPSLALGETSSTAYRGDRGKAAYDHSQSDHSSIAPAFSEASTRTNIASGETVSTLFGKIKKWFTDLKTVAFSGSYNDLTDKPSIPDAQVQSNWNETNTSSKAYIQNKPTIPAAQVNSDWNASSGVAKILNKPTIPSLVGAQNTTGTVKNGSSVTSSSGYTACPIISGVPYYKDTNTTTGTSYNAGSCPDNTTFATNGSVARAYSALNSNKVGYKSISSSDKTSITSLPFTAQNNGICYITLVFSTKSYIDSILKINDSPVARYRFYPTTTAWVLTVPLICKKNDVISISGNATLDNEHSYFYNME